MTDRTRNPYAVEEVPTVAFRIPSTDAAAFRVFLAAIVYTHTFGQRQDLVNRWIPLADDLLAQTGQKFVKGIIRPADWQEEEENQ